MAIPELTLRRAERLLRQLIDRRVPAHIRDEVRMSIETRGNNMTLFEHRPVFRLPGEPTTDEWTSGKMAQFRYNPISDRWTLYWSDRNGRWLRNPTTHPTTNIAALIREVDKDPAGAFWG